MTIFNAIDNMFTNQDLWNAVRRRGWEKGEFLMVILNMSPEGQTIVNASKIGVDNTTRAYPTLDEDKEEMNLEDWVCCRLPE